MNDDQKLFPWFLLKNNNTTDIIGELPELIARKRHQNKWPFINLEDNTDKLREFRAKLPIFYSNLAFCCLFPNWACVTFFPQQKQQFSACRSCAMCTIYFPLIFGNITRMQKWGLFSLFMRKQLKECRQTILDLRVELINIFWGNTTVAVHHIFNCKIKLCRAKTTIE